MTINKRLKWLKSKGCYPCISRRGEKWRAHVNRAGNQWAESTDPGIALETAVSLWIANGNPMDGEASILKT